MNIAGLAGITALALAAGWPTAQAQNVKITPLGSHAGELCKRDRATIFEDPTGVRILYDAGQSVTRRRRSAARRDPRRAAEPRARRSHRRPEAEGARKPAPATARELVSAAPNSTTAEIAAAKNAAIVMVGADGELHRHARWRPSAASRRRPARRRATTSSRRSPRRASHRAQTGRHAHVSRPANAARGVEITIVPASHDSTVPRALLERSRAQEPRGRQREPRCSGRRAATSSASPTGSPSTCPATPACTRR